jgi:hypothetical protein
VSKLAAVLAGTAVASDMQVTAWLLLAICYFLNDDSLLSNKVAVVCNLEAVLAGTAMAADMQVAAPLSLVTF